MPPGLRARPHRLLKGRSALTFRARSPSTFFPVTGSGVQRGLVGEIIKRFEQKGFKLVALKLTQASKAHMEKHYEDLKEKKFFPALVQYMISGPVVCMVWEGKDAIKMGRMLLGATKPSDSLPGTIRGDFAVDVGRNICHGSDAVESANAEIKHWFPEGVVEWASHSAPQLYE